MGVVAFPSNRVLADPIDQAQVRGFGDEAAKEVLLPDLGRCGSTDVKMRPRLVPHVLIHPVEQEWHPTDSAFGKCDLQIRELLERAARNQVGAGDT